MSRYRSVLIALAACATCTLAALPGCSWQTPSVNPAVEPVMYPLPPAPPRIAYLTSIDDETFLGYQPNRMARFLFGHDTNKPETITKPFGLAAGHDTLLICDTQKSVVHVLDFKRGRFETLGASGRGKLLKPVAVALDEQANRYVADTGRQEVVVFSPDNEPIRTLGQPRDAPFKPVAVAIRESTLYVLNGALHRVEVLDPTSGELLEAFGEKGEGPGQMLFPSGLALDAAGQVYVTDLLNCRVQVFAPDGHLVQMFGRRGDRAGELSRPKHLAVGPDGIVYVVDAAFQRVQMFDGQGQVLMLFGGPGDDPGSMTLPAGICTNRTLLPYFADRVPPEFDAAYLVFVGNQFGPRRVGIYAFGSLHPGAGALSATRAHFVSDARRPGGE